MSAMDPGAQPAAPAETTAPEAPSTGPDLSPVFDRLDQLGGMVSQLAEQFQPQQPQEPEVDWWQQVMQDPSVQPPEEYQQPVPQQPQLNVEALQQAMQQAIAQSNQPLMEQVQRLQQQAALNDLTTRIPQLKDPEVAKATQDRLTQSIAHLPQQIQQQLAWDPNYVELVFKAAEAEKLAQAQEPAGESPQLETAGGAHPGGTGEEPNFVQSVYASRPTIPKGLL